MKNESKLKSYLFFVVSMGLLNACVVARKYESERADSIPVSQGETSKETSSPSADLGMLIHEVTDQLHFGFNSAEISLSAKKELEKLGEALAKDSQASIHVDGFADSVGSEHYNEHLSDQRAKCVSEVLIEKGVQPSQIHTSAFGEARPVGSNQTESGRAMNRRVEITLGG